MNEHTTAAEAWETLFRAQVSIMRDLRAEFTDVGMSMNEYDVLFNIAREPDHSIRLRDLNANVLITQSSVSRLVDRLVARGLISKCGDDSDARGTIVSLTPTGERAYHEAAKVHARSILRRVGSVLNSDELDQLQRLCARLRDATCASS